MFCSSCKCLSFCYEWLLSTVINVHFIGDDGSSLSVDIGLRKFQQMQRSLFVSTKTEVSQILQSSYKENHVVFESSTVNRNAIIGSWSVPGVTNINISAIIQKVDNKSCET